MVEHQLDLGRTRRLHVTNVGGAGMSAVAILLAEMGHDVSGHDPAGSTPFLDQVRAAGVVVATGSDPGELPPGVEALVVSTATGSDDPQVVAAIERGIPVVHRSVALAAMSAERTTVAVAGTHGKTTTSGMLATLLQTAGVGPGWVVGSGIPALGRSAAWGGEGPLVVEADESDGTFLALDADVAVVTNVEPDHLEHWGDFDRLVDAFRAFVARAGTAIVCADDRVAVELAAAAGATTYGTDPSSAFRIRDVDSDGYEARFSVDAGGRSVQARVRAPGAHNARNATAAIAAAVACGLDLEEAVEALAAFSGVARRFEHRGHAAGVTFVDSYDHLPTEVRAALATARLGPWGRIVCTFQPHRYSRTAALGASFADAFVDADLLCLTDIYPAGEEPRPGVSGRLVLEAVLDAHPWARVAYLPTLDDVVRYLAAELRSGDLCLTLGAGDLTTVPDRVIEALEPGR